MPNLAVLLKLEISRLSRREIRKEILPLRKASAVHRREIAALKRTIASLSRRANALAKSATAKAPDRPTGDERSVRFVAKGLVSLRKRLGFSAAELAQLLGVSMQSVYNWERKQTVPRTEQISAIAALRALGKKEARQRLDAERTQAQITLRGKGLRKAPVRKKRAATRRVPRK